MLVLISGTKQGARELGPLRRTYILGVYVDATGGGGAPSGAGGSDPPPSLLVLTLEVRGRRLWACLSLGPRASWPSTTRNDELVAGCQAEAHNGQEPQIYDPVTDNHKNP